ncbi:hypothetical protein [Brachyspira hyodysenteriae]|nr:hypothetical protein [Brachyspira hyodysenteriae]MDA0080906.1 hypothetical protein [Brachyspira hyodysenteriae]
MYKSNTIYYNASNIFSVDNVDILLKLEAIENNSYLVGNLAFTVPGKFTYSKVVQLYKNNAYFGNSQEGANKASLNRPLIYIEYTKTTDSYEY